MATKKGPRARRAPDDERLIELAVAKLESSGLTIEDAVKLGIEPLDRDATKALVPSQDALRSLKLNYYDPVTGEPISDWPSCPPYWRIRYLEQGTSFEAQSQDKALRYMQPPHSVPVAYYPRGMLDWGVICADPDHALIITEGELKAACACKMGFPTIGLGGVNTFAAKRNGVTWLPSLDFVVWPRRNVYICYDSDLRTNTNVLNAVTQLAHELEARGAYVHLVTLPDALGPDVKVGLDDFLLHADDAPDQFVQLLKQAVPLGLAKSLFGFNEKYVYVRNPGLVMNVHTGYKTSPASFKEHLEAPTMSHVYELDDEGRAKVKAVSAAAAWLKWPLRRQAESMTYAPGKPRVLPPEDGHSFERFNLWPGWGCQPAKGDVSMFLQLLDHLFTGAEPWARDWLLRWFAYPLQFPGVKLFTSAVIVGRRHGTGKSLLAYTLARVYGKNFTEIKQKNLHESHNEWAENKQFVLADEVTSGGDKREDNDMLKNLITQKSLRLNPKYIPSYEVPDVINYYFTSNHLDAFFLDDDDRRFFIHEVKVEPLPEEFYVAYELWMDSGAAGRAIFDYLLNLDLGDFNPAAKAPMTKAKAAMIRTNQSELGGWVRTLIEDPASVLRVGSVALTKDLYTSQELLDLYDPTGKTRTTANGLARELRRAGIDYVRDGELIDKLPTGSGRLFAVRNAGRWVDASVEAIVAHVTPRVRGADAKKKY